MKPRTILFLTIAFASLLIVIPLTHSFGQQLAQSQSLTNTPSGQASPNPAQATGQPATGTNTVAPNASSSPASGPTPENPTQGYGFVQFQSHFQPGNPEQGQEIVENGSGGVPACADCHGLLGEGNALQGYPYLANLPAFYIYHQLLSFKDQTRPSQTMQGVAFELNQQQMLDIATYYSQLPPPDTENTPEDRQELADAQKIFEFGKSTGWDTWTPACYLCHGRAAGGVGEIFPALAGQSASYIEMQLRHWQQGERTNDPNGLMTSVAAQLTAEEAQQLARYLSILPASQAVDHQGGQP